MSLGRLPFFAPAAFARASEEFFAVAVDHLANLDRLCSVFVPIVGCDKVEVAGGKKAELGLVRRLDRHIQEAGELLVRVGAASFNDVRFNTIGRLAQLSAEVAVPCTPEWACKPMDCDRQCVRPLPHAEVPEVLHGTKLRTATRSASPLRRRPNHPLTLPLRSPISGLTPRCWTHCQTGDVRLTATGCCAQADISGLTVSPASRCQGGDARREWKGWCGFAMLAAAPANTGSASGLKPSMWESNHVGAMA